jgi:hypothetical protein
MNDSMTGPMNRPQTLVPVALTSEYPGLRPRGYRPAVVVDANALISDAIYRWRCGFSLMPLLAERNDIALVTAAHIDEKVYARLPVACRNTHAYLDAVTDVYETRHRPVLRLVSVGNLMLHDERVGAAAVADPEDVPLAQLGVLLAPALVLTRDKHLLGAGIGVREWADALSKLKELVELERAVQGVTDGVLITGALTVYGVGGLIRALMRSDLALGLALGAALGLGLFYRDELAGSSRRLKERATPVFEKAMDGMSVTVERWEAADGRVRPTLVRPHPTESLEAAVARTLLPSPDPLSAAAIQTRLPHPWRDTPVEQLMGVLREQPAFELVRGRGWTLGHAAPSPR